MERRKEELAGKDWKILIFFAYNGDQGEGERQKKMLEKASASLGIFTYQNSYALSECFPEIVVLVFVCAPVWEMDSLLIVCQCLLSWCVQWFKSNRGISWHYHTVWFPSHTHHLNAWQKQLMKVLRFLYIPSKFPSCPHHPQPISSLLLHTPRFFTTYSSSCMCHWQLIFHPHSESSSSPPPFLVFLPHSESPPSSLPPSPLQLLPTTKHITKITV